MKLRKSWVGIVLAVPLAFGAIAGEDVPEAEPASSISVSAPVSVSSKAPLTDLRERSESSTSSESSTVLPEIAKKPGKTEEPEPEKVAEPEPEKVVEPEPEKSAEPAPKKPTLEKTQSEASTAPVARSPAQSIPVPAPEPEPTPEPEPVPEPVPEPEPPVQQSSGTVYWTPNGKSYHSTKGCRSLARSKTILSGTMQEAKSTGHGDPCNNCVR